MRRTAAFAALTVVVVGIAGGGCTIGEDIAADLETAAEFDGFPFYWLGDEFEDLEVSNVALGGPAVGLTYGTCRPTGGHGCAAPLQIQIFPLCSHLDVVAANRIWARRQIRGAPVGAFDGAPVMFTRRTQIKVYRGEGSDPGLPLRALEALRSLNDVEPTIGTTGTIPPPAPGVLEGTAPCRG